jgi:chaperone BCS1
MTIRVTPNSAAYEQTLEYVAEHVIDHRFTRNYVFGAESKYDYETEERKIDRTHMTVGYGTHFGFYKKHFVVISREENAEAKLESLKESLNITIYGYNKSIVADMFADIDAHILQKTQSKNTVLISTSAGDYWNTPKNIVSRHPSTIILPEDVCQEIIDHIYKFEQAEETNRKRGLPHRTGIILHGLPGTSKSSIIHAVASATERRIQYLSLGAVENDKEFNSLITSFSRWNNAILVIEDIDATKAHVKDRESGEDVSETLSLSTLLNTLDGLISPHGLVTIVTTNHFETLDPALIRPGRFDLVREVGYLGKPEFERMARLFDHDPSEYTLPYFEPMSGAQIRSLLLQNGVKAVEHYQLQMKG